MKTSIPVRRTVEIEEFTNLHFIHPLAGRLVPRLARWRVTPNAVSLTGLLCGVLAGIAYFHYRSPAWDLAGFALMIAWHVMDGADGQLARLTHSQSHFGKVLDGVSDALTFFAVYAALALALHRVAGDRIYALVIVAAVCHAIQAATYEAERQEYDRLAWGLRKPQPTRTAFGRGPLGPWLLGLLDRLYCVGLSFPAAGVMRDIGTTLTTALARQPEREAEIRERYRETFAPQLRRWSFLSANYHTLGIFVCALLKAPEVYFWSTIVGFNAMLVGLIRGQRERLVSFAAILVPPARPDP